MSLLSLNLGPRLQHLSLDVSPRGISPTLFILFFFLTSLMADSTHRVARGESAYSIAQKYGITVPELLKANQINDSRKLKIGQNLIIPTNTSPLKQNTPSPPEFHIVKTGETLHSIAIKYDQSIENVKQWNQLKSNTLRKGQQLRIAPPPLERAPVAPPYPSPVNPNQSKSVSSQKYLFIDAVKSLIDLPRIQHARWKYIVIHHSGTTRGNAAIFDLAHRQRGMENGLAYHFLIGNGSDSGDGQIEVGSRWLKQLQGGHLKSDDLNEISIGICLIGNFNDQRPSRKQLAATIELITYLREKCGPSPPKFTVHSLIHPKHTECPGRNFPTGAFQELFGK